MRHRLQIRAGRPSDADRLAVLATQVWLGVSRFRSIVAFLSLRQIVLATCQVTTRLRPGDTCVGSDYVGASVLIRHSKLVGIDRRRATVSENLKW